MKRILCVLLCALMVMSLFAGCGDPDATTAPKETEHKHSYSKEWSHDNQSHWYEATCGHALQMNLADHEDADKNGECDVCGWFDESHTHTFDEVNWKSDAIGHWHAATCGHTGAKKDAAEHQDANNDGSCDVCAYTGGHVHTFDTQWSSDATQHWYKATCGHDVKDQLADHEDANLDGVCDVCGWFDESHTHNFSQAWATDVVYHWHAATCEHIGAISERGQHADTDADKLCDTCGYEMCDHRDFNDDGQCDQCGWADPEHTHEYQEISCNRSGHWYVATCHSGATSPVEEHVDKNQDGICDVCQFQICAHSFDEAWSMDETHHWHAVLCTCSIGRKDYAEHTLDDTGACTVCMYGMKIPSVYEVVIDKEPYTIVFEDKINIWCPFTVSFPQAGKYVLYPSLDEVKITTTPDYANMPTDPAVTIEVDGPCEMDLYFYLFDFNAKPGKEVPITYSLVRMDDVVIETMQGKVELPTNTIYKLVFKAPQTGTYNLITSVNNVVIGLTIPSMEYYKGHIDFEVTEVGQEVEFYVELRDLSKESFIFDWVLEEPFSLDVENEGNYAVSVDPKKIDYKINFIAPADGSYRLSVSSSWLTFCAWNEIYNQPTRLETTEVLTGEMKAGDVYTIWLQAVYNYPESTNIYDTLTVSNVGEMIPIGNSVLTPGAEGGKYTFQATESSYYRVEVENGMVGVIAANGTITWTDAYEVKLKAGYSYTVMVRGEGDVKVSVTLVSYKLFLDEGNNAMVMVPAKEYDVEFDDCFIRDVNGELTEQTQKFTLNEKVKITWDNPKVKVFVNGVEYAGGTEVEVRGNVFTITAYGNKDVEVSFKVEVTNAKAAEVVGEQNAVLFTNQAAKLAIKEPGTAATGTFTAEVGGTYTFYCYTEGVRIYVQNADGTTEHKFDGEGSFTFQVEAGQQIVIRIEAQDVTAVMTVDVEISSK